MNLESPTRNCSKLYAFLGLNCAVPVKEVFGTESGFSSEIRCNRKGNPEVVITSVPRSDDSMAKMLDPEKAMIVQNFLAGSHQFGLERNQEEFDFGFESPPELAQEDSDLIDTTLLVINEDRLLLLSPGHSDSGQSMDSETLPDSDEEQTLFYDSESPNGQSGFSIPNLISADDLDEQISLSPILYPGGDVTGAGTPLSTICPRERTNGSALRSYVGRDFPATIYRCAEKNKKPQDINRQTCDQDCKKMYISNHETLEELKDAMQNLKLIFEGRKDEIVVETDSTEIQSINSDSSDSSSVTELALDEDLAIEKAEDKSECTVTISPPAEQKVELCEFTSCGDSGISGDDDRNSTLSDSSDDEGRQRLRRCSSLKSYKTPPGTPGTKKIVRFADAMGLDLADVRTFLEGVPNIPKSAFQDLAVNHDDSEENLAVETAFVREEPQKLMANFAQPGTLPDFIEKVKNRRVCLESAEIQNCYTLKGMIRLLNISFYKSVVIRYTMNEWNSFTDIVATYILDSCDGLTDKFEFVVTLPQMKAGDRILFAVCYRVGGQEFWDNNCGFNYSFTCVSSYLSATRAPVILPIAGDRAWVAFLS